MRLELVEIALVPDNPNARWKVRALSIDGVSPALAALDLWRERENTDFKKIIKSLLIAAQSVRVTNERFVKKCANLDYGAVYEARADKSHARLMFFYSEEHGSVIVCTNDFWKGKGSQDLAFAKCARLKALFEQHTNDHHKRRPSR